jgi:hypothetical protein
MQEICKEWIPIKIMKLLEKYIIEEYIDIMMYIFKKYINVILCDRIVF